MEGLIRDWLKKLGLEEGLWEKIKVEKEEDVPAAVMKFAVDRGVESVVDKRVSQAVKTREDNLKKEFDKEKDELAKSKTSQTQQPDDKKSQDGTTPDIAQIVQDAITKAVAPLGEKVAKLEAKDTATSRASLIKKALKDAGYSEKMAKHIVVDSDDEEKIAEAVKTLKGDIDAERQTEIDRQIEEHGQPVTGNRGAAPSEIAVTNYTKEKNAISKSSGGKFTEQISTKKE